MAAETGYQAQVAPSAGPGPVLTSAAARGAGVAQALEGAGDMVHASQLRAYQVQREQDRQAQSADFYHRLATIQTSNDALVDQLRSSAQPGGVGHVEQVRAALDKQAQDLFGGITEQAVMTAAREQWDSYSNGVVRSAQDWAEGQRIGKTIGDNLTAGNVIVGRVRTSADPQAFAQATDLLHGMAARMQVPPDVRDKFLRQGMQDLALADLANKRDRDPVTAQQALDSGVYDDVLAPHVREQVESENRVALARADAMQRQQQAAGLAQAREVVATAKAQIANGSTIDAAALAQATQMLRAAGDTSTAESAMGVLAQDQFARQYQGQTPLQMSNRLAVLQAKADRSQSENLELKYLQDAAPGRAQAFREDSAGYYARFGKGNLVPPPLNLLDPASAQARVAWQQRVSAAAGQQVNVLTKDEAWTLQQQAQQNVQGRVAVLSQLDAMPDWARGAAARQIMPGDAGFRQEALLRPDVRATVYNGREQLRANSQFLHTDHKTAAGRNAAMLLNVIGGQFDTALRAIPADDRAAIRQSATDWLVGYLSSHGRSINTLTPADIRVASSFALGGTFVNGQQIGGLTQWHGGNVYVLPDNMSENDFLINVSRDRMAKEKAGAGPTIELQLAHPVLINGTARGAQYRWETAAGRIVKDAKGRDYISTVEPGP